MGSSFNVGLTPSDKAIRLLTTWLSVLMVSLILTLITTPVLQVESKMGISTNFSKWTEKKLIKDLLHDYDKRSRPVVDGLTPTVFDEKHHIQQITIYFGLQLVQILDLNEMDQVLTTSTKSLYRWIDYHLQWDPKDYGNIMSVNIPTDKLWLPDIALYNYADERLEERRKCDARVFSSGTVEWHPMAIYKSTCPVHIKFFPFDKQACKLKFGPWTYDGFRVNISHYNEKGQLDLNNYVQSPEWNIIDSKAVYKQFRYPCCNEPYPDISFYIWMERQPAFYNYILILPCFLLSSLTLVLFWLPPETPAKMVLGMNIFVAFFLLLLLLEDTTPSASSTFPLIGTYYCLNMGIITLSTFLSVIVVNFHFRGDNRKEVPYWLKKLAIQHGSRLLLLHLTHRPKAPKPEEMPLRPGAPSPDGGPLGHGHGMVPDGRRTNNVEMTSRQYGNQRSGSTAQQPQSIMDLLVTQDSDQPYGRPRVHASSSHLPFPNSPPHHGAQTPGHLDEFLINYLCPTDRKAGPPADMLGNAANTMPRGGQYPVHYQHAPSTPGAGSLGRHPFAPPPPGQQFYQHQHSAPAGHHRSASGEFDDCSPTSGHGMGPPPLDVRTIRRINAVTKDVGDIVKSLRYIQRMNECKERVNRTVAEWRAVAMVLDRLFFVCYVITIILSIILFFPKSGNDVEIGNIEEVK